MNGGNRACKPAQTTTAQPSMEKTKPPRPSIIIGLRPLTSDTLAQCGAVIAQNRADNEKTAATRWSEIPIARPIAGMTEISPRLPTAMAMDTTKIRPNTIRGRPFSPDSWAAEALQSL
ncbi:hypothetical protein D3C87_1317990 [compost metagenome]